MVIFKLKFIKEKLHTKWHIQVKNIPKNSQKIRKFITKHTTLPKKRVFIHQFKSESPPSKYLLYTPSNSPQANNPKLSLIK